jgi:hypothetical protein
MAADLIDVRQRRVLQRQRNEVRTVLEKTTAADRALKLRTSQKMSHKPSDSRGGKLVVATLEYKRFYPIHRSFPDHIDWFGFSVRRVLLAGKSSLQCMDGDDVARAYRDKPDESPLFPFFQ